MGGTAPTSGWPVWGRPLLYLGLLGGAPFLLLPTPLKPLAVAWAVLLALGVWALAMAAFLSAMAGLGERPLHRAEEALRAWVARFAPDPEALWLRWAREAHHRDLARRCLDRAVALGGAEALFLEGLVFLEGGFLDTGQILAVERFGRAAALGHPEAMFRLAEALRTGQGAARRDPAAALAWYRRSAGHGFGPAAAWLARACADGDGVARDEAEAQRWAAEARRLEPHPPLRRQPFHPEAAPEVPLVALGREVGRGVEEAAGRLVAHPVAQRVILVAGTTLAVVVGLMVLYVFLVGSSVFFFLPVLVMVPSLLMLGWIWRRERKEGPDRRRDRLREAAEGGDLEACYRLGLRFREGRHPHPKDDLEAFRWFEAAARAGHAAAMEAVAEAYQGGHGVVRDPRAAARWADAARQSQLPGVPGR